MTNSATTTAPDSPQTAPEPRTIKIGSRVVLVNLEKVRGCTRYERITLTVVKNWMPAAEIIDCLTPWGEAVCFSTKDLIPAEIEDEF